MGRKKIIESKENGLVKYDTIDHTIAEFSFYNQDSLEITNQTFDGKLYVADFFFTSCPTICPIMKKQMLRVFEKYEGNETVNILSHTIDPTYDNVDVLHEYAERLGVHGSQWHFVTGDKEDIFQIGEKSYMITAGEDDSAPGGYIHGGAFLLIDDKRRIRGVYDGTEESQVSSLLKDIDVLLQEITTK